MECINCKKEINEKDNFCGYCGAIQPQWKEKLDKKDLKEFRRSIKDLQKQIKAIENKINFLEGWKEKRIAKIIHNGWNVVGKYLHVNNVTREILICGENVPFEDVKSAKIERLNSTRIETVTTCEPVRVKNKFAWGKAAAGMLFGGPLLGVGLGLGGSKKDITGGNTKTTTTEVPICTSLTVKVNTTDKTYKIPIITSQVNLESKMFKDANNNAQKIVKAIEDISQVDLNTNSNAPENHSSVLSLEEEQDELNSRLDNLYKQKRLLYS